MGAMLVDRVRVPTTYPLAPQTLIDALRTLVAPLPAYDRIAAGFPGMVRGGRVLSAPHFVTQDGPGTRIVPLLVAAWSGYDLAAAIEQVRRERGLGVSAAVNELIRTGLTRRREREPFIQRTSSGQALMDVTNVDEALELLERPGHP